LDFAHQPKVVFVGPKPGETVRAGEGIRVEAVLVDPSLDVMITDIEDTTKKTRNFSYTDENGKKIDIIQFASLDPLVEITDSKGKQVASGSMPFG
jgi:hypothetical protein